MWTIRIPKIFGSQFLFLLCIFSISIYFFLVNWPLQVFLYLPEFHNRTGGNFRKESQNIQESVEPEMACKLPKLDPFDKSIRHLTSRKPKPANCEELYPPVFRQSTNNTLIRLSGTQEWKDCCYKVVGRNVTFKESPLALPFVSESTECYTLTSDVTVIPPEHEFIGVYCTIPSELEKKNKKFYEEKERVDKNHRMVVDSFAFTPLKLHVEDRIAVQLRNFPELNPEEQVNVVMIGLDAMSQMNLKRTMPRVVEYMEKTLGAISMNGYVRVGEDTFDNSAAFLTNMTGNKVEKECIRDKRYGDTCPFIWKDFWAQGYRTSIVDDWPRGETFAYNLSIVDHPPADYHLQPLNAYAFTHTGGNKRGLSPICVGPRLAVDLSLQYVKNMAAFAGNSKRYFQFLWSTSLTHEDLVGASLAESSVLEFLQWFQEEGHLNNTILVMLSDHGARSGGGDIIYFSQGKIEGNMPYLYFIMPEWMKEKFPRAYENLKINSNRLTTPFDLYATLKDILQLNSQLGNEKVKEREVELAESVQRNQKQRGISLFLPVPTGRTCKSADIGLSYCVCRNKVPVNISSPFVKTATYAAVKEVNRIIKSDSECSVLQLLEVISATQDASAFSDTWLFEPQDQVLEVEFRTSPGNATFSAVMTRKSKKPVWSSSGRISRTNLYGDQSHCVSDKFKKNYCYCKDNYNKVNNNNSFISTKSPKGAVTSGI